LGAPNDILSRAEHIASEVARHIEALARLIPEMHTVVGDLVSAIRTNNIVIDEITRLQDGVRSSMQNLVDASLAEIQNRARQISLPASLASSGEGNGSSRERAETLRDETPRGEAAAPVDDRSVSGKDKIVQDGRRTLVSALRSRRE
jgi:hypothetical protein